MCAKLDLPVFKDVEYLYYYRLRYETENLFWDQRKIRFFDSRGHRNLINIKRDNEFYQFDGPVIFGNFNSETNNIMVKEVLEVFLDKDQVFAFSDKNMHYAEMIYLMNYKNKPVEHFFNEVKVFVDKSFF